MCFAFAPPRARERTKNEQVSTSVVRFLQLSYLLVSALRETRAEQFYRGVTLTYRPREWRAVKGRVVASYRFYIRTRWNFNGDSSRSVDSAVLETWDESISVLISRTLPPAWTTLSGRATRKNVAISFVRLSRNSNDDTRQKYQGRNP